MGLLKNLSKLKDSSTSTKNKVIVDDFEETKVTYFQDGYGSSKSAMGNTTILKTSLENVFEDYKEKSRKDKEQQAELKKPHIDKIKKLETEAHKRAVAKEIKQDNVDNITKDIDSINFEISEVKNDPNKYGIDADKKPKAQFFIGLFILLPLTIYLMVFYISASYSAFFKEFKDSDVMTAIFDGNSLTKAFGEDGGLLEGIFVIFLPFVFMGLGYLIHMYQKETKWSGMLKITGIFIITFIFDALLAYQIEKKIFDFEKTLSSPDFDFQIAFSKPEFWTIIFAGFLVYIIWGLVFDFIMKEYENFDKIQSFIRAHKENRKNVIANKQKILTEIASINNELAGIEGEIKEIQSTIDGFIFEEKKYLLFHTQYLKGWLMAIQKEIHIPHKEKNELIDECDKINITHILKLGLNESNYENLVYKK
jgi:hypothetical protein